MAKTMKKTSVLDALFSRTQQRLLSLAFGQPQRAFAINELIALTGSGSGAVQRELKKLVESGLVERFEQGRQKLYRANRDAFLFPELFSIVHKTMGVAGSLREALAPLGDRVTLAVLFGSVAKHTDHASSDIDVLIVADQLTLRDVFEVLAPAEKRLGRKISPTVYTRREFEKGRGEPFLRKVLGGDHVVLVGNIDVEATR